MGLLADPPQAAALDLDVDGGRATLGRPVGEPVEDGAQEGAVGGVVQVGPAPLGGGAAGEQQGGSVGSVDSITQTPQALQGLGRGGGRVQRIGGGRLRTGGLGGGDQGVDLLKQVDAQLEDVGTGVDGAAGLGPRVGDGRPGQGDGHRGQATGAGDAAPAPGQRRRAHARASSVGACSGTSDRAMPSRMS